MFNGPSHQSQMWLWPYSLHPSRIRDLDLRTPAIPSRKVRTVYCGELCNLNLVMSVSITTVCVHTALACIGSRCELGRAPVPALWLLVEPESAVLVVCHVHPAISSALISYSAFRFSASGTACWLGRLPSRQCLICGALPESPVLQLGSHTASSLPRAPCPPAMLAF